MVYGLIAERATRRCYAGWKLKANSFQLKIFFAGLMLTYLDSLAR